MCLLLDLKPSEINFCMCKKLIFKDFELSWSFPKRPLFFFCRVLLEKTDGIDIQGFSRKASNGGTAWLNETIRNELFQLQKVHF